MKTIAPYLFLSGFLLILSSCGMHDAADPFSLAPCAPSATWTPFKGNRLISSRFCETLLPTTFGENELSLAELIDIGLSNNPSTKQTWANARSVAAQYGQSLSPFYPNIQFTSQFTRARGTFIEEPPPVVFFTTTAGPDVELSYTLFDFGQRTSAAIAARESLYFADWTHNQEVQTIIQIIMGDYYNYLYQLKLQYATQANFENAGASLDAANQKFALGLAALGDVAQARTQFLQNKINLTTQKQNVENAFAQLSVDLGLPANLSFKVQQMPETVSTEPMLQNVDDLIAIAQSQRQDLLAAAADIRSKEALLLNAKRAVYPVLATNLDIGKYWFNGGFQEDYHFSAALTLSFPLFNGFYYKNAVKKAIANLEFSKAQFLNKELAVVQAVTTSHMNVKTASQNLHDSDDYLKSAELEFNIALSSYKAGTTTILEVISAQSSLADARSKKAGSMRDWYTSLVSIAYATGCLCTPKQEEGAL